MISIEIRNPTESQPIEITQLLFQSASYTDAFNEEKFLRFQFSFGGTSLGLGTVDIWENGNEAN